MYLRSSNLSFFQLDKITKESTSYMYRNHLGTAIELLYRRIYYSLQPWRTEWLNMIFIEYCSECRTDILNSELCCWQPGQYEQIVREDINTKEDQRRLYGMSSLFFNDWLGYCRHNAGLLCIPSRGSISTATHTP